MAIITEMLGKKVISGFKGVLDFYYWMGIPVVRTWPRKPSMARTAAVQAQWPAWAYVSKAWQHVSPVVQAAYRQTAQGTSLSGRDLQMKAYISSYFRAGQWT